MEEDSELVLLSALEHYSYCPRQCALIHQEMTFDENLYTLQGRMLHEVVDSGEGETEAGVRIERGVPLWSKRLGLVGKADMVEFHPTLAPFSPKGLGEEKEIPYPVEYKRGPKRKWGHDDLQVCAQALCLEEMLGVPVPKGAVFHHGSRRRREVVFDEPLRKRVEETTEAIREMLKQPDLPAPLNDTRCEHCSLRESCMPSVIGEPQRLELEKKALYQIEDK
jgi:CRISPR-associated exonuclease Cas4